METRIFNSRIQLRSAANGGMVVGGYAARFNIASKPIPSRNGGSFQEILKPTAFSNVLGDPNLDTVALVNHDANKVLGRTGSRTLRLHADNLGLQFEVDLSPNISFHRDLHESVKRGDMNGASFAFQVDEEEWEEDGDYPTRTIRSVKSLRDVSIVTDPAYPHTAVGIRSDVDLAEVRSRYFPANKRPWRQDRIWRSSCEFYGVNPDTASTSQLVAAYELHTKHGNQIVAQRHRSMMDFLLS